MLVRRWIIRVHKWIALIVGIQILLWIAGGLVMSAIPIEVVRGEHKVAEIETAPISPDDLLPVGQITNAASLSFIESASTSRILGKPVWRIVSNGQEYTFDATTGEELSPISESLALEIANADYSWNAPAMSATLLTDPPAEYSRPGPVWQIRFDDIDSTTLYVDATRGDVRARRSTTWRFYDFFWKLHVMDYDDGASFNHPLIITAAGTALIVAMSGLGLLYIRMRQLIVARRRRRLDAEV